MIPIGNIILYKNEIILLNKNFLIKPPSKAFNFGLYQQLVLLNLHKFSEQTKITFFNKDIIYHEFFLMIPFEFSGQSLFPL